MNFFGQSCFQIGPAKSGQNGVVCGHLGPKSPRFEKKENAVTWDHCSQVRKVCNLGPKVPCDRTWDNEIINFFRLFWLATDRESFWRTHPHLYLQSARVHSTKPDWVRIIHSELFIPENAPFLFRIILEVPTETGSTTEYLIFFLNLEISTSAHTISDFFFRKLY